MARAGPVQRNGLSVEELGPGKVGYQLQDMRGPEVRIALVSEGGTPLQLAVGAAALPGLSRVVTFAASPMTLACCASCERPFSGRRQAGVVDLHRFPKDGACFHRLSKGGR
jgi:hypothetical protein